MILEKESEYTLLARQDKMSMAEPRLIRIVSQS